MTDHKQKKPMTASDYIKNQPHLQGKPLITQNTFSALAEYPPLSYKKAVTTQPSTQASPSDPKTTQATTQKSEYILKPQKEHLMTTHFLKPVTLRELQAFTNRVFYEENLFKTDNLIKNRTFYEYILVDSQSAEITHHLDPKDQNRIAYSTFKILKICSIQDLGFINLHTTKPFSTPGYHIQGYSYVDYQNAFFRALYLRAFDHSWFLSFDTKCSKTIPGWFCEWWHWFGPTPNIYPEEITKTSLPFYIKNAPNQPIGPFTKIAFHIDMGIPWICSWHFNLIIAFDTMPYSLVKEYRVKWWDKYNLDRCSLANIANHFQIINQTKKAIQTISKQIPLANPGSITPTQLIQKYGSDPHEQSPPTAPTLLTPQELIRQFGTASQESSKAPAPVSQAPAPVPRQPPSPAYSGGSSTKTSGKNKIKLLKLLNNLVQELPSDEDDEDEDMQDSAESDPFGGPLAQCPYEI